MKMVVGEVVLFGGKRDEEDVDDIVIVLREVCEEIGLDFFFVIIIFVF